MPPRAIMVPDSINMGMASRVRLLTPLIICRRTMTRLAAKVLSTTQGRMELMPMVTEMGRPKSRMTKTGQKDHG